MSDAVILELISKLGGLLAPKLGIDLHSESDGSTARWFLIASLMGPQFGEDRIEKAYPLLCGAKLDTLQEILHAEPQSLISTLEAAGHPKPEANAAKLRRAAEALDSIYAGSFDRLAGEAESVEDLAGRIAALASGVGPATVLRFLRPLRDRWLLADEIPLDNVARSAAIHLKLIREGEDEEGSPGALRAAWNGIASSSSEETNFADLEAALTRLGQISCRRGRAAACPLPALCPLHNEHSS